ncbi:ATP-binding protein [Desulfuromonas sp. AOP6]|uniref:ATP-binding protein n=1 Tax=Desulfuromonas sp. AOP6 TaxID=1566351 RepID=UPI0012725F4E|nr:ATP-binding protein [Desulfuromonas sp. AOP6]BCA79534.1 PAS domain-containing sensor histidine kinase [Desulfuromonas sp. AOP6]
MKNTLEKRILLFAFVVLTLTILVNTGFNIEGFRRDYRDGIVLRCQNLAGELKGSIENVVALGVPMEELDGLNARFQGIVTTDPDIIYCFLENQNGQPLFANDPSFHFISGVDFTSSPGSGVSVVNFPQWGKTYDVSLPITSLDGETVGTVRLGFPDTVLDEKLTAVYQRSMVVLGLAFLIVFALIVVFARRHLIGPIDRLCSVAKEIASGHFQIAIPTMPTRDFAELATALTEMSASLQERDEKLQEGYQELESTNLELQKSYEYQEKIGTELRRSREMYRSLLEDASDAIMVTDDEDRVVLVNKAAEVFFGVKKERVEGANFFSVLEMLHCDQLETLYDMHQRILAGETLEAQINYIRLDDQRPVVGWVRGSHVVGMDGRHMVQTIVRDVTQEKEIKDNLEKSAWELQRLNQMKDSFLGVASHELKTPLTVIVGYADLILSEKIATLDTAVAAMIQNIADAAQRLSGIVRDMVDVSMLDSKNVHLKTTPHNLNQLVRQATKPMVRSFEQRKQSLVMNLQEALPEIYCDGERMVQVIGNLVGNALKFTPDGGKVYVETRLLETLRPPFTITAATSPGLCPLTSSPLPYVEIVVRDTGIGIDGSDQGYIFDKFYEAGTIEEHSSGKVSFNGKGAGLGLAIVKGIINMHGGEIWVESAGHDPENCPGSSFHILLPQYGGADLVLS